MNPDDQKKIEDQSFGRQAKTAKPGVRDINPNQQGISNRPGDEDPDSGVDREPGEDQAKDQRT